jgi:hypothetical protein
MRAELEANKFATGRIRRGGPVPQVVNATGVGTGDLVRCLLPPLPIRSWVRR